MLRICHMVSGDLWAGAEVMACHLLKGLQSYHDLEIMVIVLNHGRLALELKKAGLQVHVIDENRHSFLQIARSVRKLLVSHPPHILHAHRYKENLLAFVTSRVFPGSKLISTQHGLPEIHGQKNSPAEKIKSSINFFILKRFFNKVVGVSRDIQKFFINELGFSEDRLEVIHNGVKIPRDIAAKPVGDPFVIGSSGRLFPVKDYPLMVDIAGILALENGIYFSLAGEGPERDKLENSIIESALDGHFILRGHLDDMDSFYRELDLYINTSVHEGIPMTILEAMAKGLPVIAPRVGGIPEIVVHGAEGFLIEDRNPTKFAEKCLLLYKDRKLWAHMAQAARNRAVSEFSVERMAAGYLEMYRNLA